MARAPETCLAPAERERLLALEVPESSAESFWEAVRANLVKVEEAA